jgi:CRISPR-associated endonuclease/helicase Cas3
VGKKLKELIAHVRQLPDGSWAQPHSLEEHLEGTSEKAAQFAGAFHSKSWGLALGLTHDLGKSWQKWQAYLCRKSGFEDEQGGEGNGGKMDHSSPGAKSAEELFGKGMGRILSYCIAGHHAGLPDWLPDESSCFSALSFRLANTEPAEISPDIMFKVSASKPNSPPWKFSTVGLDLSLWIRMLFSCLVDADFLDTEEYMEKEKASHRGKYLPVRDLLRRFDHYMIEKVAMAGESRVNRLRQTVLADSRCAAANPPGFFSLTVPTGGGKTLSSLAFALEHAARHGLERIIYVIPYTSIIEQNADVFRAALGADQVVEHHSNLDSDALPEKFKLAAENWDASIIVTTSVQFFESLFAARPGRCRKLHNIAKSVVILDEAQLIPVEFLEPILRAMDLLVQHYGVTFVVSTATQPALQKREGFKGLESSVVEIIRDVPGLYRELKRVSVEMPNDWNEMKSWEQIADELKEYDQVLCVVSDRKSCRELHRLMPKGTIHLSALMCGQHRSEVIMEIREKLNKGEPVRVISTQLVEAGVDVDFPVVYRALAGLDSIAQAAGRCNREGKLTERGKVVVFRAPKKAPPGILRKAAETTETLLKSGLDDPLEQKNYEKFFGELYWKANSLDGKGILNLLKPDPAECGIQFRTASDKFRLIDDQAQRFILVPYGEEGEKLIAILKAIGPERWLMRKLQRFSVNVYLGDFNLLERKGAIDCVSGSGNGLGLYAVNNEVDYDAVLGLLVDDPPENVDIFLQ